MWRNRIRLSYAKKELSRSLNFVVKDFSSPGVLEGMFRQSFFSITFI